MGIIPEEPGCKINIGLIKKWTNNNITNIIIIIETIYINILTTVLLLNSVGIAFERGSVSPFGMLEKGEKAEYGFEIPFEVYPFLRKYFSILV